MGARTKARRRAVDLLFEAESRGVNAGDLARERAQTPVTPAPLNEYTVAAVQGVVAHWSDIDDALTTYSQGWSLERMPDVDRAILRLGAWEILFNDEVPDGVAVSEAVTLATELSTDESPKFVNGLLARIVEVKPTLV
ncbi:transcription antitermination factor NusB [Janibacter sp. CX7]|uniref:transcription antitermination factor NusB n=1 Tax=Janibacter sp. CX7 TaxID=2963431 RepID=UPI0020CBB838|nr:transcription antitermination factor NusB [Janibacter sp. CX7]UTT64850.1 transcription antitermination factor NusB [Janibacter sp. CX7]